VVTDYFKVLSKNFPEETETSNKSFGVSGFWTENKTQAGSPEYKTG